MGLLIDVDAEVAALVGRIKVAAADEHEERGLLMRVGGLLHKAFTDAQTRSEEAKNQLVLEARAASVGMTVDEQKNAVGAILKKRAEDVTATDALEVVIFRSKAQVDAAPGAPLELPATGPADTIAADAAAVKAAQKP